MKDWMRKVRRAGVPLVALECADPAATIAGAVRSLNGKADSTPVMQWDILRGLTGVNDMGRVTATQVSPGGSIESGNPAECLKLLADAAPGVWSLRDAFKARHAVLVMLAPSMPVPAELKHDLVVVTEELPNVLELAAVVESICQDAGIPVPGNVGQVAESLLGVSGDSASLFPRRRSPNPTRPGCAVYRAVLRIGQAGD